MGLLIDASVLIDRERGGLNLDTRLDGRADEVFLVSVVTVSELLHGVHRARTPVQRARRSAFVEAVIDRMPLLGIDPPTARFHAELWAELASKGTPIGPHDLWLAAQALAHGLALATSNTREFHRVPGLELEDWGEDRSALR